MTIRLVITNMILICYHYQFDASIVAKTHLKNARLLLHFWTNSNLIYLFLLKELMLICKVYISKNYKCKENFERREEYTRICVIIIAIYTYNLKINKRYIL